MASLSESGISDVKEAGIDEVAAKLNNFDFFQSIRTNNISEFGKLLDVDKSLLNSISNDGFSGLQMAAKYGHIDMVEILLDRKADPTTFDVKYGRTFLHWASVNGHSDVVFLAIRDFPDVLKTLVDLVDNKGNTSLMLAAKGGRKGIVSLLLAAGADVNVKIRVNNVDKTVFDLCSNASEMLSLLNNRNSTPVGKCTTTLDETTSALVANGDIQWGLSSGAGISQLAHNRTKCITLGWMKRNLSSFDSKFDSSTPLLGSPASIRLSSEAFGADSENGNRSSSAAVIQDVVVKLNLNPRELREEFAFRELLDNTVNSNGGDGYDNGRDSSHYFVSAVCPNIITLTEKSQLWYGILLEKGVIDLHHLYVAMTQHSTHSRLNDLRWKLHNVYRIVRICNELLRRDLVWYDLKPSNFIVFPADEKSTKIKQHKWIQQSSWDASTFKLKATDLSSIYSTATAVPVGSISCTAKFLAPSVAKLLTANSLSSNGSGSGGTTETTNSTATTSTSLYSDVSIVQSEGVLLTTCPAHMLWSLGMCSLQLLDPQYSTVFAHLNLQHASEVYDFLNQEDDIIQKCIDEYVAGLVDRLLSEDSASKLKFVENDEAVLSSIREGLVSFLRGLLHVDDSQRSSIAESLQRVENLLKML